MYTWWAFVRTTVGGFMTVTIQAPTQYQAQQQLRLMYGSELISEAAMAPNQ
jgi:hypothetical protein